MVKLKYIKLINYCGYRHFEKELADWSILYGPNGSFKSSFLYAVQMLCNAYQFQGRSNTLLFRKLTYHPNYIPGMEGFDKNRTEMYMEGIFETDEGEKRVVLKNDWDPENDGVVSNELGKMKASYLTDADNPSNMYKFQLLLDYKDQFLDFANSVYGFESIVPTEGNNVVVEYDSQKNRYLRFALDFVISKYGGTLVHFKRMSDGEKKIATMLRSLFNDCYDSSGNTNNIILIDNIEMHIYFKRHMKVIEKMQEHFPNRQFIVTTHSPIIIEKMPKKYLIDMEEEIGQQ